MNKLMIILTVIAMMAITTGCHTTYNRYYDGRPCYEPAPTVVYQQPAPQIVGRPCYEPAPTVVYQQPAPQIVVTPAPAIRAPVVNVFAQGLPAGNTFFNPRVEYYGRGRQTIFHTRSEPAARVYYHQVEASPSAVENVRVIDATRVEY